MQAKTKLVVVLIEAEELVTMIDDWPVSIELAVCLLPSGEHHFIVFHKDEKIAICGRLERQLKLTRAEFQISPAVDGYETRRMLFSDTQMVWALIAETNEALEQAEDYAENYRFAQEEGLDPALFLGVETHASRQIQSGRQHLPPNAVPSNFLPSEPIKIDRGTSDNSAPFSSQRADPSVQTLPQVTASDYKLPMFLRSDSVRPSPGFFCLSELGTSIPADETWTVHREKLGLILFERHEFDASCAKAHTLRVQQKSQVFLRKTTSELAVRYSQSNVAKDDLPGQIIVQADILPRQVRAAFGVDIKTVKLRKQNFFLYIVPCENAQGSGRDPRTTALDSISQIAMASAAPKQKHRPLFRRPLLRNRQVHLALSMAALALVTILGFGILSSAQAIPDEDFSATDLKSSQGFLNLVRGGLR